MSYIETLLENEGVQEFSSKNENIINEAEESVYKFRAYLKEFVLNNPKEFLAENIKETKKNIRTFAEVATAQYIAEVSSYFGQQAENVDSVVNEGETGGLEDYL